MNAFAALLLTVSAGPCDDEVSKLFRADSFTSATLAEAVNHYIALGEETTVKQLSSLATDISTDFKRGYSINERIGWVCRILFEPKESEPLRAPRYGALLLPWNSMPLKSWPLYPVAVSGSTYFVLSQGYILAGVPEDPNAYIHYCRSNGRFRKTSVPIPTREQALKDLQQLRETEYWKAIKWEDKGQGFSYDISEDSVWRFITKQAEGIPVK